ncbi:MAG: GNAT family N-acetyltransferase [Calditrichaeota bacterium]|nr:GNAT family N-acetyltransferase [Calditrichota bacterium]
MLIRKYNENDKLELIRIFKRNTPKFFDIKETDDFIEYLDLDGENYFVIEIENKIVGGIGVQIENQHKIGRITWIFFHPDYSGKGLGKFSVEHCLGLFSKNPNIKKVIVTTSQLAYKFFEKFNFIHTNTEKNYWGKGLHLYTMELNPIPKK